MDLSGINLDSLGDILNSLSEDDIKNISAIAENFAKNNSGQNSDSDQNEKKDENDAFSFDPEMLFKLMGVFEKLNNSQNDPRCKLISALKPLLSPPRRQKADQAMEMMKIFSLFSQGDIFGI